MKTCQHCRKKFETLNDEAFVTPKGQHVFVKQACENCIHILRQGIEAYICADIN